MPWRETRDPYRIWVSEVMLQQTQVATATPYYERFVARFPDVRSLARADLGRVLALWSGLGYYRRARHLHEAAGIVVREHGGRVPSDPRAFATLPGVGRYTLGAVLSMGFGLPWPVLDGNVARVLARLTARPLTVKRPADARELWALAESLLPRSLRRAGGQAGPGEWNQALMELGALVCTPRAPRCVTCPLRAACRARALGLQDSVPPVAARRTLLRVRRAVACVRHRGRLLVVKREGAHLDGLWEPPGVELERGQDVSAALAAKLEPLGIRARLEDSGARERHTITHHDITVEVWEGELLGAVPRAGARHRWVPSAGRSIGLSALGSRLARRARAGSKPTRGRARETLSRRASPRA